MSPAYHSDPTEFPPHLFRPGDVAELQNEAMPTAAAASTSSTVSKQRSAAGNKSKSKHRANQKPATGINAQETSSFDVGSISAVVYRVYENRITVALKRKSTSSCTLSQPSFKATSSSSNKKKSNSKSTSGGEEGLFRLIKVANDSTYDRMKATLLDVAQRIGVGEGVESGVEQELLQMGKDSKKEEHVEKQQDGEKKLQAEAIAEKEVDQGQTVVAVERKQEVGKEDSQPRDAEEQDEVEEDGGGDETESDTADEHPTSIVAESSTSSGTPRSTLLKALLGLSPFTPGVTPEVRSVPHLPIDPPFNAGLNTFQIEAIKKCIYLPGNGSSGTAETDGRGPILPFHLIHGPPGTGKTTTVVELLLQIALGMQLEDRKPQHLIQPTSARDELTTAGPSLRPARILVCGASNLAVDTIAERLLSPSAPWSSTLKENSIRITRIGHPARVLASLTPHTLDAQVERSDANLLVRDIHREIAQHMQELNPDPTAMRSSSSMGTKRLKGSARKDKWELVRSLRKELRHRQAGISTSVLSQAHIVLSTLHGAGDRSLFKTRFDYIIIDEACQALEPSCWIAALKAREDDFGGAKLILAGDHRQLGPTIKSEPIQRFVKMKKIEMRKRIQSERTRRKDAAVQDAPAKHQLQDEEEDEDEDDDSGDEEEQHEESSFEQKSEPWPIRELTLPATIERTMFDRLLAIYGPSCKSLLSVQYRMNTEIMAFPNKAMYDGKLEAHSSCAHIRLGDLPKFEASGGGDGEAEAEEEPWEAPVMFLDTQGANMHEKAGEDSARGKVRVISTESKYNEHEVELVERHVASLVLHGLDPGSIAIIAPYSAQVAALATALRPKYPLIEIGTVDGMQGREKDAVIITLVRSNDKHEVGFLREKRRLNVAMTRAKRHLAIIGDSDTVAAREPYLKAWLDHLQENAVLEYAFT